VICPHCHDEVLTLNYMGVCDTCEEELQQAARAMDDDDRRYHDHDHSMDY